MHQLNGALEAERAIRHHAGAEWEGQSLAEHMTDLLINLMHLARRDDIGIDQVVKSARRIFREEADLPAGELLAVKREITRIGKE